MTSGDAQTNLAMPGRFAQSCLVGLLAMVACLLTLASVLVERAGPELGEYGNLCGSDGDHPCLEPMLNGGFPIPYLFDQPGVSVEGKLSFVEDTLRPGAFVLDVALYFSGLLLLAAFVSRLRSACRPGGAEDTAAKERHEPRIDAGPHTPSRSNTEDRLHR